MMRLESGASPSSGVNWPAMAWTKPAYSRERINAAGKMLLAAPEGVDDDEFEEALAVINNHRSSH
jgi:hypothetical protein